MTGKEQRDELHRQIWTIANDVRGAVDEWDFKQFVFGALFYRFMSENFTTYIEGGDDSVRYSAMSDATPVTGRSVMQLVSGAPVQSRSALQSR